MQEMQVQSLGQEDPLEKEMATYSSILAWEIPWTVEPGRLQSIVTKSQTQLSTDAHVWLTPTCCLVLHLFMHSCSLLCMVISPSGAG